ncbi:MAG: ChbG/HpnK family deacetylase [Chloroflexi bacterium]|nr:ChbG/HpnK family deacetylase [Chloroflexota bacterium]
MKQLIVNADDFGRSPGVNRGIIDAHRTGIVTSTTVMINQPAAPAGLEDALQRAPHLGIGLHLNLTSGRPVSPPDTVPTLVDGDGQFYDIRRWPIAGLRFNTDELAHEITAQFERFVSLTGQPPDHLDAHHHATYLHPAAFKTMLGLAGQYALPLRASRLEAGPHGLLEVLQGLVLEQAQKLFEQLRAVIAGGPPPFWPARFETGFYGERATLGDLLVILTNLPDNGITELMCHPGYVDDDLRTSRYVEQREAELAHLTHAATRECVQSEGIQLITFGDLRP